MIPSESENWPHSQKFNDPVREPDETISLLLQRIPIWISSDSPLIRNNSADDFALRMEMQRFLKKASKFVATLHFSWKVIEMAMTMIIKL